MKLDEAKQQFIESWGSLGTSWGINKTMALIHALLLSSDSALSAEEIMEQLNISRGNVNMNLRALINWGLAEKKTMLGERKEFFTAEKSIWKIATYILKERRKRELEPLIKLLDQVAEVDDKEKNSPEGQHFSELINEMKSLTSKVDLMLALLASSDEKLLNNLLKVVKTADSPLSLLKGLPKNPFLDK